MKTAEINTAGWLNEWKKQDPLVQDLKGFQLFCDVKALGGGFPLIPEDIFLSIGVPRREWPIERYMGMDVCRGDCIPKESNDAHWERDKKATMIVREVIADKLNKDPSGWREHLNDSQRHLEWIKETFGVELTEKDYEEAWLLFEHKEWFSDKKGYYIRGWLAIAEVLGVGLMARKMLETTPFPHANKPKVEPEKLCEHMDICPIYHYREWLRLAPIEIPDLVFRYTVFQSNVSYNNHNIDSKMFKEGKKKEVHEKINRLTRDFRVKWKIRKMIHDYLKRPRCKVCGEIAYDRKGDWEGLELCWEHILIMERAYVTKINPLTGPDALTIPHGVVEDLRRKLIAGDEMFDGVTVELS